KNDFAFMDPVLGWYSSGCIWFRQTVQRGVASRFGQPIFRQVFSANQRVRPFSDSVSSTTPWSTLPRMRDAEQKPRASVALLSSREDSKYKTNHKVETIVPICGEYVVRRWTLLSLSAGG